MRAATTLRQRPARPNGLRSAPHPWAAKELRHGTVFAAHFIAIPSSGTSAHEAKARAATSFHRCGSPGQKGDPHMDIGKFLSSPFVVEYFKDAVLVVLVLFGFALWAFARRKEMIASRPPEVSSPRQ
jgi:hypothetical protein